MQFFQLLHLKPHKKLLGCSIFETQQTFSEIKKQRDEMMHNWLYTPGSNTSGNIGKYLRSLDTFIKLGMIESDENGIYLVNFEKHQSLDKLEKMKEINEAYETLSDENKRKQYDIAISYGLSYFHHSPAILQSMYFLLC